MDGIYAPTQVPYLKENNLKATKVSCGQDHTLLMTEDENKVEHFYSIGKEETSSKHLGCSTTEAAE